MSRLKDILAERKRAKAQADAIATTEERTEEQSSVPVPVLALVPAWDFSTEDEFSPFF